MNDSDIQGVYTKEESVCYICNTPIRAGKVAEILFTSAQRIKAAWSDSLEEAIGGLVTDNNYAETALCHISCLRNKKATNPLTSFPK